VGGNRLNQHVAYYVFGYAELSLERTDSTGLKLYPRHDIIAVFVPLDGVRQAALAPGLLVGDFTAEVGDDGVNALRGGGEFLIAYRGPDNVHQFVVTHLSFTPPLHGLAPSP
jgi:hypothetical protein